MKMAVPANVSPSAAKIAIIFARLLGVVFGLIDLQSSLWFGAFSELTPHALYVASPTFALLVGSLLPNSKLRFLVVRIIASLLIIVAVVRYFTSMLESLEPKYGPDYASVMFAVLVIVVLIALLLRVNQRPFTTSTRIN